ncbi:MAG: hypothetical protein ABMA15_26065 [Vicinamibacterales bacterium]
MSVDGAIGVAVILFVGGFLVIMPIMVGDNEGERPALLAAALAITSAQMLWAVARCPFPPEAAYQSSAASLKQGARMAYGMAAVLILFQALKLAPDFNATSRTFLVWTAAGVFAAATVLGGLFPVWRHLLRFPVGALFIGGVCGTIVYWSVAPAAIVAETGQISWAAARAHLGVSTIAGFAVGPLLMLHFFFKSTEPVTADSAL